MNIPVSDLKDMATRLGLTHVIVLAFDDDSNMQYVATYGRTLEQCSEAADWGNRLKDELGWPESLHAQPARVQQLQEEIRAAHDFLDGFGAIASGRALVDRVRAVVRYYAAQVGRFAQKTNKINRAREI